MITQSVSELVSQLIIQSEEKIYFLIKKKIEKILSLYYRCLIAVITFS